jgi:hypothetical protein
MELESRRVEDDAREPRTVLYRGEGFRPVSTEAEHRHGGAWKCMVCPCPSHHTDTNVAAQFLETFTGQGGWHNTEVRSYNFDDKSSTRLRETERSAELRKDLPLGGYRKDLGELHENPMGL